MALTNPSAGSRLASVLAGRHHSSAPITPRLLTALTQNGAAIPATPMMLPASAGPMARLILIPTLLADTAGARSRAGTSCGTTDCQAGADRAPPTPIRNMNSSSVGGVTWPNATSDANTADSSVVAVSTQIRNRRLSKMSARAPAASANMNIGRLLATWTSDTSSASPLRLTISQPLAALYIQLPIFDTTVAIQMTANARCWNAARSDEDRLGSGICRGHQRVGAEHAFIHGPRMLYAGRAPRERGNTDPRRQLGEAAAAGSG